MNERHAKWLSPSLNICYMSEDVVTKGKRIKYMFRTIPLHIHDSGWRFYTQFDTHNPPKTLQGMRVYGFGGVASYDPTIINYLDKPIHTCLEKVGKIYKPVSDRWCPVVEMEPLMAPQRLVKSTWYR